MDTITLSMSALTNLSFLLIIGMGLSILSDALRIPRILLLIITGLILSNIYINGNPIVTLPQSLIFGIGILSLIMIIFSGTSTLKLKEVDIATSTALKLLGSFLFFNILFLLIYGLIIFGVNIYGFTSAMILAILSSGSDAASVFSLLKEKEEISDILKIESVLNTPIVVVLPLLFARIIKEGYGNLVIAIIEKGPEILKLFLLGIGTGVVIAIILFKILKHMSNDSDRQVMLFSGAFLTYVLAESLNGDGIIAVATLGVMFANYYTRISTAKFSIIAARALEILIFLLLGLSIKVNLSLEFLFRSIVLFLLILIARCIAVKLTLPKKEFTRREQLLAIFLMPKGIATGVTALALVLMEPSLSEIGALILIITIYSLILSSLALIFLQKKEGSKE